MPYCLVLCNVTDFFYSLKKNYLNLNFQVGECKKKFLVFTLDLLCQFCVIGDTLQVTMHIIEHILVPGHRVIVLPDPPRLKHANTWDPMP